MPRRRETAKEHFYSKRVLKKILKLLSAILFPDLSFIKKEITNSKYDPQNQHQSPDPNRGTVVLRNGFIQSKDSGNNQEYANYKYKQVPTASFHFLYLSSKIIFCLKIMF